MIRIVHTLGGCGGTLLSRCLGVLPQVSLLSEINPASVKLYKHFCPLYQDQNWLHLLHDEEHARFSQVDLRDPDNFRHLIAAFDARAKERGNHLVIRDFTYIDFVGVPFNPLPPRRLTIYDALPAKEATRAVVFIRHPIDQWVSLCKHVELLPLDPAYFCDSYSAFLNSLASIPIYKYENFVRHPELQLKAICRDLSLQFEASCFEHFHDFDSVTGDLTRLGEKAISLPERGSLSEETLAAFRSCESYWDILNTAGYSDRLEQLVSQQ